jgi:glycosyltransferase involved in cell wall biosynthesis
MKVVVFAHTPPPFHGQSYMVKLMLAGLGETGKGKPTPHLQLFHVDAKLSSNLEAIGKFGWAKIFLLLKYCFEAWQHRFAHRVDTFYYIPAPGKRNALYRDWIVLILCRPLFRRIIFHWHAVGLGEWIEEEATGWERWITHRLFDRANISIVLSEFGRADAMRLLPRKIEIVPNGIPDPCPDFDQSILPHRQKRFQERGGMQTDFRVLFAGACTAAKGLFATLEAIALTNKRFTERQVPISVSLTVAGEFVSPEERKRFDERIARPDLRRLVEYAGFVSGEAKRGLFRKSDCLCFPSLYPAEGQPVTIMEALAFGLPVVATRWRGIPDLLNGADGHLIEGQNPNALADALEKVVNSEPTTANRNSFLARYRLENYLEVLGRALTAL